jgi:DHA1 family multidrug resistance protein-like MFS transporter
MLIQQYGSVYVARAPPSCTAPQVAFSMTSMQSTQPPFRWQTTVRILWVLQFASMAAFGCSLTFVPLYILDLGVSDPRQAALWAGIVAGGSGLSMAIFSPIWGSLADRFGKKIMLERAFLGATVTLLLMGFAQTAVHLLILRIIQGSLSGTTVAFSTLVSSITPREHLGRVLGSMQMAIFAGTTIGPFIGGVLADTLGFRAAFISTSAVCLIAGIVILFFVHEPPFKRQPLPRLGIPQLKNPLGNSVLNTVLMLAPVIFLVQFSLMAARPVFPLFVAEIVESDAAATFGGIDASDYVATIAGLLIATTGVVATLCSVITGRFIDSQRARLLLIAAVVASALANVGHAVAASLMQIWLVRVLIGTSSGIWAPTYSATVGLSVPSERRGLAFGIAASASSLGNAVGPVVGGYIGAMLGIRAVFMAAAGALLVAAVWIALRVKPSQNMEAEE